MLNAEQIQSLNQKNQSVDAQKTKERVKDIWLSLDKKTREEVLSLCGLTQFAVRRTYENGNISAKTVCAISQTLKINPYYLIGESDEKGYFTDDIISDFIRNRNITVAKNSAKAKTAKGNSQAKGSAPTEKTVKAAQAKTVGGNKNAAEKTAAPLSSAAVSAAAPSAVVLSKTKAQAVSSGNYERDKLDEICALSNGLFANLPNAQKDKIEKISEAELSVLLSGMVTRAKINGDNNNLLKLLKYILSC